MRLDRLQRDRLRRLSPYTRRAVKAAFVEWWECARAAGYEPLASWGNVHAEVDHSALLDRILTGGEPLPEPPPKRHGYPDYTGGSAASEEKPSRPSRVSPPGRRPL